MIGLLRQDLKRTIINYRALLIVGLICSVTYISGLQYQSSETPVMYLTEIILGLSMPKKIIVLISVFFTATLFCEDWLNRYSYLLCIRSSVKWYAWSKIMSNFISTFFICLLGMILTCVIWGINFGWYTDTLVYQYALNSSPFIELFEANLGFLYIIFPLITYSLSVAVSSLLAMAVSIIIPDTFVTVVSAMVLNYLVESIEFPLYISFYKLARFAVIFGEDYMMNVIYHLLYFIILSLLIGCIISWLISRRVLNVWVQ